MTSVLLTPAAMVAEFHGALGRRFGDGGDPTIRRTLHVEEFAELVAALDSGSRVAVLHELADVVYVCYGSAYSLGLVIDSLVERDRLLHHRPLLACQVWLLAALREGDRVVVARCLSLMVAACFGLASSYRVDLDAALAEVHRANMSKFDEDGRVVRRVDGKVCKGPRYRPPDVTAVLARDETERVHVG